MKINVKIEVLDDTGEECKLSVSGVTRFDEFGVVQKVNIDSSSFGTSKENKKKTKKVVRAIAERVRAEVLEKIRND